MMIPAIVSWRGAFHARKPCGAFSSTCTFFLLFTSTPGRHYTLSHSLAASCAEASRPATRQAGGEVLSKKRRLLAPLAKVAELFSCARSDARRTQGTVGGG